MKPRRFASTRLIRKLAGLVLFIGLGAPLGGVAYAVNGATQAQAFVIVDVKARGETGLSLPAEGRGDSVTQVPLGLSLDGDNRIHLDISGVEQGSWLEADAGALKLRSWGSTVTEQLLSRADSAAIGLGVGVGALLLRRLLLSIAEGEPFRRGNAARLAGIAGVTAAASLCVAATPGLAAGLVLDRLGLDGADSPVTTASFSFPAFQLLIALLLLALAEAFRRGGELAKDVDGLV